jgi:hypothetical protein
MPDTDIALLRIGATLMGIVAPNKWLLKHRDLIGRWADMGAEARRREIDALLAAGELVIRNDGD